MANSVKRSVYGSRLEAKKLQQNVFGTSFDDLTEFVLPYFKPSREDYAFLKVALLQVFLFTTLKRNELKSLIGAFEKVNYKKGSTIIQQGDTGDFFYCIRNGIVGFEVNGTEVGTAANGGTFGELSLLYTAPRAATCIAKSDVLLYRVDEKAFKFVLHSQTQSADNDKLELVKNVPFLKDLRARDQARLVKALTPHPFTKGDVLVRKGDVGDVLHIIQEGKVSVTDIRIGGETYENQFLGPGDYFGERSLVTNEPRTANCIGASDGMTLCIDKKTFNKVLGEYGSLVLKANDKRKLHALKIFECTKLDPVDLASLTNLIHDEKRKAGEVVFREGDIVPARLVLIREGTVHIESRDGKISKVVDHGGYFGEEMLSRDARTGDNKSLPMCTAGYSVTVVQDATWGYLSLEDCRHVINTTIIGKGKKYSVYDEVIQEDIPYEELDFHSILGQGTFGQVWLVSRREKAYALKIQSKHELILSKQAKGVVREKNVMAQLQHPFIISLIATYQDEQRLFMLLRLVQGGELFSYLSQNNYVGIPEAHVRFFAAGILEGLTYMHRRNIVYRDLKPENVLIDDRGYPVIVDLGFAKKVFEKTYTLCGTPLYLAPEVIRNRGHDKGADHWSLGVLIYEMICGVTPFYEEGMEQIDMFKSICSKSFTFPEGRFSEEAENLIFCLLEKDPSNRLGSLAQGPKDIYAAEWFQSINFHELKHKEIRAPWVPDITSPLDACYFDDWSHLEDRMKVVDPPISAEDAAIFKRF